MKKSTIPATAKDKQERVKHERIADAITTLIELEFDISPQLYNAALDEVERLPLLADMHDRETLRIVYPILHQRALTIAGQGKNPISRFSELSKSYFPVDESE
ncbi:MAG: hypothetical protein WKF30_02400 [Pyrinomonadaceae bacterium]